jgi:hypothetical protein
VLPAGVVIVRHDDDIGPSKKSIVVAAPLAGAAGVGCRQQPPLGP